jgi:hypothetical protein
VKGSRARINSNLRRLNRWKRFLVSADMKPPE